MTCQRTVFPARDLRPHLKLLGRTRLLDAGLELSWSASGFALRVTASRLVLRFADYVGADACAPVCVRVSCDTHTQKFVLGGTSPCILFDDLGERPVTVTVLRVSEGDLPLYLTDLELWGVSPTIGLPPPPSARRMLFLGDSLTCGYGTDSRPGDTVFRTWEEDVTHAFAYLTAEALEADYQIVSVSGQGITRNCNGEHGVLFSEFWDRARRGDLSAADESGFVPQIIVVNGGTNDCNGKCPAEELILGFDALIDRLHAAFPRAHVVLAYGLCEETFVPVQRDLVERRRAAGDGRVLFCRQPSIHDGVLPDAAGCNWHPTTASQQRAAAVLIGFLRETVLPEIEP
ncbi:MAG: hypothetical protein J6125_03405 [Clostridia bacterium]|nr:hypothetical protein [Clostridia bacterium]